MANTLEKDVNQLTLTLNKALNGMEAPLKTKHARTAIITTHKTKESKSLWIAFSRQPIMENRFTAWKFCHLLHKVLREGHESILKESLDHTKMILELGNLWGHLQDGVGKCIQAYCKLMVTKMSFHKKNLFISRSLVFKLCEIDNLVNKDLNFVFQLCIDVFDYLDDIIELQALVFVSVNMYRMSSMTQQGQCRLAPLITLIQESNSLYDICVRLMFGLYEKLTSDILCGHKDRFGNIFTKLKIFYDSVRPLQYFADLIQVPSLPAHVPNFASKIDLGRYEPPVVLLQPNNEYDANAHYDNELLKIQKEKIEALENCVLEKTLNITCLQSELSSTRNNLVDLKETCRKDTFQMQEENNSLKKHLAALEMEKNNIILLKNDLELKLANTSTLIRAMAEEDETMKLSVEKFTKLKAMYVQIRDEHINLIRQQSDTTKSLNKARETNETLNLQIKEIKLKAKIAVQNNVDFLLKLKSLHNNHLRLLFNCNFLKQKIKKFEKTTGVERIKYNSLVMELTKAKENLKEAKILIEKQHIELAEKVINHNLEMNDWEEKISYIRNSYENDIQKLNTANLQLNQQLAQSSINLEEAQELLKAHIEKYLMENELKKDLEAKNVNLEASLETTLIKSRDLKMQNADLLVQKKENNWSLVKSITDLMGSICLSKLDDIVEQPIGLAHNIIKEIGFIMDNINKDFDMLIFDMKDENVFTNFKNNLIKLGYIFPKLYDLCSSIHVGIIDTEVKLEFLNKSKLPCHQFVELFQELNVKGSNQKVDTLILKIKATLLELDLFIENISDAFQKSYDIDELVTNELKEMDSAIEEAATRILNLHSNSKQKNNGIKLEVHEKILDACTSLMNCIRNLIQKSYSLQQEIICSTRGNSTVKEFYKKNSQWSEGLISASKSIAKAANFLVDAANKAITTENGNNFELIVAAQEIAACTAQLVIASKVKAPKDSQKLSELTNASRCVSKATGVIVATVQDCNAYLEMNHEIEDYTCTPSQMKTMEIEIHVKILELEQALNRERLKLASFRKAHYQNTEF